MSKARYPIPELGHPMIETHCHLDYLQQAPLDEIVTRAHRLGVERIVTIAVAPKNLATVVALTRQFERVYGTQGVHPHEASSYDSAASEAITTNLATPKIIAVGEIGLDYHYDHAPRQRQREVFAKQLAIAAEHDYPVVIHTREAEADTKAILDEYASQLDRKGVIHSFTSSADLAEYSLDAGFYLGFNGIITFGRADNVRAVLLTTPMERILLETDAPYLTPVPYRGHENAPFYLPLVAEQVARVKQMDIANVLRIAYDNSEQLFFTARGKGDTGPHIG